MKLPGEFYHRHVLEVARDLLGKTLIFQGLRGIITETEAYRGVDDEASHAFRGITKRSQIMFGPPGYAYVYLIYGMYHCLNIVTEPSGQPSAVLIRGLKTSEALIEGPGRICRHLGITMAHNGLNILQSEELFIEEGMIPEKITATPRMGIKKAQDKLWRFVMSA